jgi:hypothetical protein
MAQPLPQTPFIQRIVDVLTPRRTVARMRRTFDDIIVPVFDRIMASVPALASPPTFPNLPVTLPITPANPFVPAPSIEDAQRAHADLKTILHPPRQKGVSFRPFLGDDLLRQRLEMVKMLFWLYTHPNPRQRLGWIAASMQTASNFERGTTTAQRLREWARAFMADRDDLPVNLYGAASVSMLAKGDLASAIFRHLQSVGKYVKAMDIVWYLDNPDVQAKYGLNQTISLATAKRWMALMDYRWTKTPKGTCLIYILCLADLTWPFRSICRWA